MAKKLFVLGILIFLFTIVTFASAEVSLRKGKMFLIDGANYDYEFIHNYTKFLNEKYRFKTFITFSKDRVRSRPASIVVRSLEQALIEDFKSPIIVWGTERTTKFRNIIGLNNLVFVEFSSAEDPILNVVDYMLEGLHFMSMLFFYKAPDNAPPNSKEIRKFFEWCWDKNIINVALVFQVITVTPINPRNANVSIQNQVFHYSPFPNLTVFNVSDRIYTNFNFIVDKISNVHGYEFKTPVYQHPPSVFFTPNESHCSARSTCRNNITGTAGRLYAEFINKINGTIRLMTYKNGTYHENMRKVILAAAKKEIHIGIHPFSPLMFLANQSDGSYPIAQGNACIIVPVIPEIALSDYLARPFPTPIWCLLPLVLCMLIVLHYSIETLQSPQQQEKESKRMKRLAKAFLYTAHTILNHPFVFKELQRQKTFFKVFYLKMFFMIFVIFNMYTCSLTSLFNIMPVGKQIDTVADFMATDYQIVVSKYEKSVVFDLGRLPEELLSRVRVENDNFVAQHRTALNTSFAYLVTAEGWQWLKTQQRRLWKPRFRIPSKELCTAKYFQKFPVQWDSPFTLSLALFFMSTQESGLNLKWQEMSINQARKLKLISIINEETENWRPLSLSHFKLLGMVCGVMWTMSILCFFAEIFLNKWRKKK